MRLQVNLRGSWRDVCRYRSSQEPAIRRAAEILARAAEFGRFRLYNPKTLSSEEFDCSRGKWQAR